MSLSKLKWTNWDIIRVEVGKALVSEQEGETCVRHALGKGIFEFLQTKEGGGFYKGCTDEELEAKQKRVIDKVLEIFPGQGAIDPYLFNGKSIHLDLEKKSLKMEIAHAQRNGEAFADDSQWAKIKDDAYNFLIIVCDTSIFTDDSTDSHSSPQPNPPLHAVYVEDYDVKYRTFNCINSWGPGLEENPYPVIKDTKKSKGFHAFSVHLVDESKEHDKDEDLSASAQPSAPKGPPQGFHI